VNEGVKKKLFENFSLIEINKNELRKYSINLHIPSTFVEEQARRRRRRGGGGGVA
jgi:hypothetical protein